MGTLIYGFEYTKLFQRASEDIRFSSSENIVFEKPNISEIVFVEMLETVRSIKLENIVGGSKNGVNDRLKWKNNMVESP